MFGFALRCWDCVTFSAALCCCSLCCFFFFPFFLQFSIIFAFACCSCCFCCCCIVRFWRHFPLLLWRNQFIAPRCCCCFYSALLLPPPPPLPSHFSLATLLTFFIGHLPRPQLHTSPSPPTNRLSHLTLCVFSIAMPFNFLARPTTLRKPPGQPHLLQPQLPSLPLPLPPLVALLHSLACSSVPFMATASAQ